MSTIIQIQQEEYDRLKKLERRISSFKEHSEGMKDVFLLLLFKGLESPYFQDSINQEKGEYINLIRNLLKVVE